MIRVLFFFWGGGGEGLLLIWVLVMSHLCVMMLDIWLHYWSLILLYCHLAKSNRIWWDTVIIAPVCLSELCQMCDENQWHTARHWVLYVLCYSNIVCVLWCKLSAVKYDYSEHAYNAFMPTAKSVSSLKSEDVL